MKENKFPKIKKSIQDFFEDEDGSITRGKALTIGGMVIVLGLLLADTAYAAHRTHSTHRTHSSHRTSNGTHGSHNTHYTHSTHSNTHNNHATHGSHDSHSSHVSYTSRSNYGSTPTSTGRDWPKLSQVESIASPAKLNTQNLSQFSNPLEKSLPVEVASPNTAIDTPQTDVTDAANVMQTPPDTPQFTIYED